MWKFSFRVIFFPLSFIYHNILSFLFEFCLYYPGRKRRLYEIELFQIDRCYLIFFPLSVLLFDSG